MAIPLTTITIPTPQPYSRSEPTRNQEEYYYVWLQILQVAKTNGEQVSLNPSSSLSVDLSELVAAVQDLTFTGEKIDIPALGLTLQKLGKTLSIITV